MALSKNASLTRTAIGTGTKTPGTRGLSLNGFQVEQMLVTKLTGDTSGSVDLSSVQRPATGNIYAMPVLDSAGAKVSSLALTQIAWTHTDNDTIAMTGLGNWTTAILFICGRAYN